MIRISRRREPFFFSFSLVYGSDVGSIYASLVSPLDRQNIRSTIKKERDKRKLRRKRGNFCRLTYSFFFWPCQQRQKKTKKNTNDCTRSKRTERPVNQRITMAAIVGLQTNLPIPLKKKKRGKYSSLSAAKKKRESTVTYNDVIPPTILASVVLLALKKAHNPNEFKTFPEYQSAGKEIRFLFPNKKRKEKTKKKKSSLIS